MVEAVKVALINDAAFFEWMEAHAQELTDVGGTRKACNTSSAAARSCIWQHIVRYRRSFRKRLFPSAGFRSLERATNLSSSPILNYATVKPLSIGIALDSVYS